MTQITRRNVFGVLGGAAGVAACATQEPAAITLGDADKPYEGEVAFEHGVASGDPLSDRVILWTRVTPKTGEGSIPVRWEVRSGDAVVLKGRTKADVNRDFCVKVDAVGLEPAQSYTYHFTAETVGGEISAPLGRTKTTAASGDTPVKFAIISCSNWPFGFFNTYDALSKIEDVDAIIHLGDYFYEYGIDGYGGAEGEKLGRIHNPVTETVTLADYRLRHAQYKTDPMLQAAHASAPWICTWDDHESTNNSYRTGAQNHNPENNEGDWTDRKQSAAQAYLEWMPVRDPEPGRAIESIYRKFEFGDVASVFALESRLTGRSDEISWFTELEGLQPLQIPAKAMQTMARVTDPSRTMLGQVQEDWLAAGLSESTGKGKAWQVLANQVIMAKVKPPKIKEYISEEQFEQITSTYIRMLADFALLELPFNLDAWDGFPAARDRLYAAAKEAKARLVTFTGDTHTAWANTLHDNNGERRGVEFGCTSVTSPGLGTYAEGLPNVGQMFMDANDEVDFYDPFDHGAIIVTLTADQVRADYYKVSTIETTEYEWSLADSFETSREGAEMSGIKRV